MNGILEISWFVHIFLQNQPMVPIVYALLRSLQLDSYYKRVLNNTWQFVAFVIFIKINMYNAFHKLSKNELQLNETDNQSGYFKCSHIYGHTCFLMQYITYPRNKKLIQSIYLVRLSTKNVYCHYSLVHQISVNIKAIKCVWEVFYANACLLWRLKDMYTKVIVVSIVV